MCVFQERNTRGAFKRRNGSRRKAPARVLAAWSNIETAYESGCRSGSTRGLCRGFVFGSSFGGDRPEINCAAAGIERLLWFPATHIESVRHDSRSGLQV